MPPPFHSAPSKLPDVGTTIFTVMSQLAAEHGAINLSQGFPDFPAPAGLLDRVSHHLRAGHNQYAPMSGLPALREQIARKSLALYGRSVDPDSEVTVTSGATEALFCAIEAVVQPGDEVLVPRPGLRLLRPGHPPRRRSRRSTCRSASRTSAWTGTGCGPPSRHARAC